MWGLSPILFTIYINKLLHQLEDYGVGCHWNHYFVGAVSYVDNIALLAPSPAALWMMLGTCSFFTFSHNLLVNASKTHLGLFSRVSLPCEPSPPYFLFQDQQLLLSHSAKHLGHIPSSDLSDGNDIIRAKKNLFHKA